MHIPKKLIIGNIPYDVEVKPGHLNVKEDGSMLLGEIIYWKQKIELSGEMSKDYAAKVLMHEVVHGILQEYGMIKQNKEDFVERLSIALYDFILNNDLSFITRNVEQQITQPVTQTIPQPVKVAKTTAVKPEPNRPKQLPLISGTSSGFSLAEVANIKTDAEETSHWETGIKVKDGENCYRTRYICPSCGNKGKRYLPVDIKEVECHSCQEKLEKKPASMEGFPNRDDFGNYFVAYDLKRSTSNE